MKEFQEDLRKGMGLDKCLKKHNLTLDEAFKYLQHNRKPVVLCPDRKVVSKNILQIKEKYYLRKTINKKTEHYGAYTSLEDAKKVRDYMDEHGWDINKVNEVCDIVGVIRRSYHDYGEKNNRISRRPKIRNDN